MRIITTDDTEISSTDVRNRIAELEEERRYEVYRIRNDETIGDESFDDEEAARKFIDNEDYDPARVTVRQVELDEDDQNELNDLRELDTEGNSTFISWGDGKIIYSSSYFDSDWARDAAYDKTGLSTDDWPLSEISRWSDAATSLRDQDYTRVEFAGESYYGEDD